MQSVLVKGRDVDLMSRRRGKERSNTPLQGAQHKRCSLQLTLGGGATHNYVSSLSSSKVTMVMDVGCEAIFAPDFWPDSLLIFHLPYPLPRRQIFINFLLRTPKPPRDLGMHTTFLS